MMKTLSRWFTGLCLMAVTSTAFSGSPVWKVSHDGKHLYLGGTVHVLTASDYPLPAPFERAYQESAIVVFEADLQALQSPEFQMALMQDLIYTDGQSLKTVLKPDTYTKLEEHCASRSIPLPAINNMQVGLASVTLTMLELQRLGIAGTGVDEYFSTKAMQDGKTLAALETSEQQLTYLKQMGKGKEDQFILYTLNDVENLPNIMRAIKDAWRTGDSQQLEKLAVLPYINEFPGIYQSLLVKRNQAWLEKIKTMLATPEVEFVLFGALHLIGDQGVIEQLKSAGYQVEMM